MPVTAVYVGCTESNEIHVLHLDRASGALTPVERVALPPMTKTGGSTPMSVAADKRFIYAGTRETPKIAASFAIDRTTGRLTYVASGPLADSLAYMTVDRTGRWLLGASYPGNRITVNPIGPAGTVQAAHQILEGHPKAHSILIDSSNRFVIVPTLGNDLVTQWQFDAATGKLSPNDPPALRMPGNSGPRHFRFHPNGQLAYLLGETDGAVYAFDWDANAGVLKRTQRISATPPEYDASKPSAAAADLHITPDGRFIYASVRATNTLAGFRIDQGSGALTLIGHTPTEKRPRGFAIDSASRYLLAVGQLSHAMSTYRIEADGRLTKLKEHAMGQNPNWIEIVDL